MRAEASMVYRGRIKGGAVVLDEPAQLPEGAAVKVEILPEQPQLAAGDGKLVAVHL